MFTKIIASLWLYIRIIAVGVGLWWDNDRDVRNIQSTSQTHSISNSPGPLRFEIEILVDGIVSPFDRSYADLHNVICTCQTVLNSFLTDMSEWSPLGSTYERPLGDSEFAFFPASRNGLGDM